MRQLVDENGIVTDSYSYDAYGNLLGSTGTNENDYLYRGEQFDESLDLQYLRARYYDPTTGRFISTDPFEGVLEQPISRHRYLYANANPVTFLDPSGEFAIAQKMAAIAVQGILAASQSIHAIAIPTAIALGLAGAIGINALKKKLGNNQSGNLSVWNGTLTLNTGSDPGPLFGKFSDLFFGPLFEDIKTTFPFLGFGGGVGFGIGVANLNAITEDDTTLSANYILPHFSIASGFFLASTTDPVDVWTLSKFYPNPLALEGQFGYAGGGVVVPNAPQLSGGIAAFTMGLGLGYPDGDSIGGALGGGILFGASIYTGSGSSG